MKDVLEFGKKDEGAPKHLIDIQPPRDNQITCLKWGPLDEYIVYGTNRGKLVKHSVSTNKPIDTKEPHKNEIFNLTYTPDFCMLYSCSRDGSVKLLHPETFDTIRKV